MKNKKPVSFARASLVPSFSAIDVAGSPALLLEPGSRLADGCVAFSGARISPNQKGGHGKLAQNGDV